jgi:hypothetical protein
MICPSTWGLIAVELRDLSIARYSELAVTGFASATMIGTGIGGIPVGLALTLSPLQPASNTIDSSAPANVQQDVRGVWDIFLNYHFHLRFRLDYVQPVAGAKKNSA